MSKPSPPSDARAREQSEVRYWQDSDFERPGTWSLDLLTHKMSEARVFLEKYRRFEHIFLSASTILELGGGQTWASCMVKHESRPGTLVLSTDIATAALQSSATWQRVVGDGPDGRLACRSHEIPVRDASVDLVFAFASAHHFRSHRRTLHEIARVLAPGGTALYLHEPACRASMYRLAHWRVNAKRPDVPEDVLRYPEIVALAADAGLRVATEFAPTTTYRRAAETAYYAVLQRIPPLQHVLPCTIDFAFTHR